MLWGQMGDAGANPFARIIALDAGHVPAQIFDPWRREVAGGAKRCGLLPANRFRARPQPFDPLAGGDSDLVGDIALLPSLPSIVRWCCLPLKRSRPKGRSKRSSPICRSARCERDVAG